ncbi:hypothetical protein P3T36_002073 [Kitasatospora sp. MAP12-15]|uniref:Yip1 family protein n=1 Tax=unclassified Kitasatospora TaxID=2633591 RepID=UPI00247535ED|nr:Yip1 family protein [Kitasatospora sp. MAP12-44]MDH6111759.1 hypothetical protein [Kitasatospora sp. MAP12-44]
MAGNGYDNGWGGGEPEYFDAPSPHDPYRGDGGYGSDSPGHTRAFPVGDQGQAPYPPYGPQPVLPYGSQSVPPYGSQSVPRSVPQSGYGPERGRDNVATYRAGGRTSPRAGGPRLAWRPLLAGIYRSPSRTFDQMRDHQAWLPALTVSLCYGLLAVLGFGDTHDEVVNSAFSIAAWSLAGAAIGFTLAGLMLGAVTYALARQLGGDGPWQSTIGLAVLVGWTTDVPRLLLALVLPTSNVVVQVVGLASWVLCGFLLTSMVRRIHDLPWGKALGAASLQLLALLVMVKLPTLG